EDAAHDVVVLLDAVRLVVAGDPEAGAGDVVVERGAVVPGLEVAEAVVHLVAAADLARVDPAHDVVVRLAAHAPERLAAAEAEGVAVEDHAADAVAVGLAVDEARVGHLL